MNDKAEIKVTVWCTAYNHERYIRRCLDGFVMQKTNFAFEVLVNDDVSTDGTAAILREYEEKYPEIIKPIYQEKNLYSQHISIDKTVFMPRTKGKIVAFCEGDDFWCSPDKLQKQVDALQNNASCRLCVCGTEIVNEDGSSTGEFYPKHKIEQTVIDSKSFLNIISEYNFQTSGFVMYAEDLKNFYGEGVEFRKISDVGDVVVLLYLASLGSVCYVPLVLSCYRLHSLGSWTSDYYSQNAGLIKHENCQIAVLKSYDEFTGQRFHQEIEKHICRCRCIALQAEGNYRAVLKREYKSYRMSLSSKQRFVIRMKAYFPHLYPRAIGLYKKITHKKES